MTVIVIPHCLQKLKVAEKKVSKKEKKETHCNLQCNPQDLRIVVPVDDVRPVTDDLRMSYENSRADDRLHFSVHCSEAENRT